MGLRENIEENERAARVQHILLVMTILDWMLMRVAYISVFFICLHFLSKVW
jgi:hypothetical protein